MCIQSYNYYPLCIRSCHSHAKAYPIAELAFFVAELALTAAILAEIGAIFYTVAAVLGLAGIIISLQVCTHRAALTQVL